MEIPIVNLYYTESGIHWDGLPNGASINIWGPNGHLILIHKDEMDEYEAVYCTDGMVSYFNRKEGLNRI